jgi:hypothetical protein
MKIFGREKMGIFRGWESVVFAKYFSGKTGIDE